MKMRRVRVEALGLLSLAIALAGYLWLSRHQASSSELEARKGHVLPTFAPSAVHKISITDGGSRLVLWRDPESGDLHDYRLGEPERPGGSAPAVDRAEVAGLLRTLDFAAFLRPLQGDEVQGDAFANAKSPLVLEVDMDSVHYRVTLGQPASHPAASRYAHTTGDDGTDRMGVVPDAFAAALSKDARELRGRLLFPHGKSQTKSLRIEGPTGRTTLEADALGFRVTQTPQGPKRDDSAAVTAERADPARIDGLFFQLARASMEAYPPSKTAATAPLLVVQVPEGETEVRHEIGGVCAEHPDLVQVVRISPDPLVGCTKRELLDHLVPRDLALDGPWPFSADEIDHIVITREGGTLDLIRDGTAYKLLAPRATAIDLERGNQFLADLTKLSLEKTPCGGSQIGQVRVMGQPEASSGGRELLLTLLEHGDTALLQRQDDGVCLELTERARWLFDPSSSWYESLDLLNVNAADVTLFRSSGPGLSPEVIVRRGGAFTLQGDTVDEALLDRTLSVLAPLRAVRIAEGRSSGSWKPRLELHIEARESGPFDLRIGPRVRGGYLASLAGRELQFILAPDVVSTLETSVKSRLPGQWSPEAFQELTVTARGVTYRFERAGAELLPKDDAPRELGPALEIALAGLAPIATVRDQAGPRPALGGTDELRLEGSYETSPGQTRRLTVTIGTQGLLADRAVELMVVDGVRPAYYVDRAAVLAVLDLL